MNRSMSRIGMFLIALLFTLEGDALAATSRLWVGPAGGDWYGSANWSPAGTPAEVDWLHVSTGGQPVASSLVVTDAAGSINVSDTAIATFNDGLGVGNTGWAMMNISTGGSVSSTSGSMGLGLGGSGTVTVDGVGSVWSTGGMFVGDQGGGSLAITGGGTVDAYTGRVGFGPDSNGVATVDGPGSTWTNASWLSVAMQGTGSLTITGGAGVESSYGFVGWYAGSEGTVSLTGAGSTWTNSESLYVGGGETAAGGTGTLTVQNGGTLQVAGTLKVWPTGTVELLGSQINTHDFIVEPGGTFTHEDGTLTVDSGTFDPGTPDYTIDGPGNPTVNLTGGASATTFDEFIVGDVGSATLNISSGGALSCSTATIADDATGSGTVTVEGTDATGTLPSTWSMSDDLWVGHEGPGSLTITGGGLVSSAVWGYVTAGSSVTVHGTDAAGNPSTWSNRSLRLGTDIPGPGTLSITGGGYVSSLYGDISQGSSVTVDGTDAAGNPSTWEIPATSPLGPALDVGDSGGPGTLTITGGGLVSLSPQVGSTQIGFDSSITVNGTDATGNPSSLRVRRLYVGEDITSGSLTVSDGAHLSTDGATISAQAGSGPVPTLTVSGSGSTWDHTGTLGPLEVGSYDSDLGDFPGVLRVTLGGELTAAGTLRIDGAGQMEVSDSGNAILSGSLEVGRDSSGTLSITGGGSVSNTDAYIANDAAATGTVIVAGSGSNLSTWTNSGSVYVGGDASSAGGTGTLTVGFGGTVNVTAGTLKLWDDGTVNLNGGTINTAALVFAGSTFNFNAGKLHFASDPGLDATLLGKILGPEFTLSGDQHLSVAGPTLLLEALIVDGGTFSIGTLVNPAKLQFNTGTLNLTEDDLMIGLGGLFGRTLEVADDQSIQVTKDAQVQATGQLILSAGVFAAAETTNNGQIQLGGGNSLLAGTALSNEGLLSGDGRISAALSNGATGLVSVATGQHLLLTGPSNSNGGVMRTTGGQIEVLQSLDNCAQINLVDGTFSVGGMVSNLEQGYISGQGTTTLRFNASLNNHGTLGLSAAEATLYGQITNNSTGLIALAGQSTATFVGDLLNDGDVYVGDGSKAVFLSRVSGGGNFPGGGDVEFADGFQPGSSPASVNFGGNVVFAPSASLEMELAGTAPGTEHDQINVTGTLTLGGTLDILLIDGYQPEVLDSFEIISGGTIQGSFAAVNLPSLGPDDMQWDGTPAGQWDDPHWNGGADRLSLWEDANRVTLEVTGPAGFPDANVNASVDSPSGTVVVTVGGAQAANSLAIGGPAPGDAEVALADSASLAVTNAVSVDADGILSVEAGSVLSADTVTSAGLIRGGGTINGNVVMMAGGTISPGGFGSPPPGGAPPLGADSARFTTVPEPGTLVLLALGAVGLLACAWRRRRRR